MLPLFDFCMHSASSAEYYRCLASVDDIKRRLSLSLTYVAVQTLPARLAGTIWPDLGVAAPGGTVCGVGAAV